MPLAISKGQNRLEQDSVVGETGLNRIQTHQWPLRIPVLLYKTELSSEGLRGLLMLRVRDIPVHGKNTSEYMKDPISEPREKRLDTWFYCWNTAKRNKSPTTRNTAGREGVRDGGVGREILEHYFSVHVKSFLSYSVIHHHSHLQENFKIYFASSCNANFLLNEWCCLWSILEKSPLFGMVAMWKHSSPLLIA